MQRFINHWQTALSAHLLPGAEQLEVPAAAAGLLSFGEGAWYKITLTNPARSSWEIVTATAAAGGVLSITRAQEGTAESEWLAGSPVFIELTAQALQDVIEAQANMAASIVALTARVESLEQGPGPDPDPDPDPDPANGLTDHQGNALTDHLGTPLTIGA